MSIDLDILFGRKKPYKHLRVKLSPKKLKRLYVDKGWSTGDIARHYECNPHSVANYLRECKILVRTRSAARYLAQDSGKLPGKATVTWNQGFFKQWTPAMAYVLGVFYTDGCMVKHKTTGRLTASLSQKEPELLEKCRALMGTNVKLYFSSQRGQAGAIYTFSIGHQEVCRDLLNLGVIPRKSLILTCPEIPKDMARHFLRGCWDGDGHVYYSQGKLQKQWRAGFTSGSLVFIEGLNQILIREGMPSRNIWSHSVRKSHSLSFSDSQCARLFHVFYDDVPASQYLNRKYERFQLAALKHDKASGQAELPFS